MKQDVKESIRDRRRSAQILAVFTKHNFYSDGFTPEEMRTTLEDLGPTYVKIGQIMSSRSDLLPESYCRELEKLRTNVKPLDAAEVRAIIEAETGRPVSEIYSEFRDEPLGSASIAQAHYGVLKDGTRVVTKVQRPGIADTMRKDFVLLKKLASAVGVATETENGGQTVDLKAVIGELEKVTEEELDFRVEAEHTRTFRQLCIEDESKISGPSVIDALTTERIMTQTYVDGYSLAKIDRIRADGVDRTGVGKAIVENYLHQVLDVGLFHGDPHQGNIMLSCGVPYWIDFGMIGRLNERQIGMIEDMVMALLQKNADRLANIVLSMGLASPNVNKPALTEDLDYLIERYVAVDDLSNIDMGALMTELTGMLGKHGIRLPSEFTMLIRSLVTIEGVLEELCPELNLFDFLTQKMIERAKESFDLREKAASLIRELTAIGGEAVQIPGAVIALVRNLSKGRMKIGIELTGYDDLMDRLRSTIKDVSFVLFACVLFIGSCILAATNIAPQAAGMPVAALIGFLFAVSLGVFAVMRMSWKK